MKACASLGGRMDAAATPATLPTVFVDGVAEPRLGVKSLKMESPLDLRNAILSAPQAIDDETLIEQWLHREVVAALPNRLVDDQVRWSVLLRGTLGRCKRTCEAKQERRRTCVA